MKKALYMLAALASGLMIATSVIAGGMPEAGTAAPAFTLPGQDGKDVSLADFKGKWVVLYFYPKDFTPGCSLEARNFQADSVSYYERNAVILGVSVDSVDSHKEFCIKQGLQFKLLADEKGELSKKYGSMGALGMSSRNTFLIDPQGIIRKAYEAVTPSGHSKEVLADLDRLQPSSGK